MRSLPCSKKGINLNPTSPRTSEAAAIRSVGSRVLRMASPNSSSASMGVNRPSRSRSRPSCGANSNNVPVCCSASFILSAIVTAASVKSSSSMPLCVSACDCADRYSVVVPRIWLVRRRLTL